MRQDSYSIDEEHRSSGFAVSPLWPLLALMFAGGWLSWPWAVYNAIALDSPTRRAEMLWAGAAALGSMLLAAGIMVWANEAQTEEAALVRIRYALIALSVFKLGCGYRIYLMQSRTLEVFEFYGGRLRNALPIVIVGFMLRSTVAGLLPLAFLRLAFV